MVAQEGLKQRYLNTGIRQTQSLALRIRDYLGKLDFWKDYLLNEDLGTPLGKTELQL
jgi:hypothetical protein